MERALVQPRLHHEETALLRLSSEACSRTTVGGRRLGMLSVVKILKISYLEYLS